ncbi:MAG: alcohol dehydrogenase catalytic domain-containing protein [Armatimonadetes bacterium]|nr:alcohol dehydrogenase catalytic domain-containing protein [Armatimonadota bacterium]
MKTVVLSADWSPKSEFRLGPKDIDGKLTYLGSKVWRNSRLSIEEKDIPKPGATEALIEVRACGICGSDVHMAQMDDQGYIWYPGLTAFPVTLGHEMSGVVVDAGPMAINKRTGRPFENGEPVCAEEMFWCSFCRPCAEGNPNQCELLQEMGFSVEGAFARYIKIDARYLWSLKELEGKYSGNGLFLAGSLVEPTSVAYNAMIECGGGIRPGDNVVVCGAGPVGLAAVAIMKRAGAAKVILSEPEPARARLGEVFGADLIIDPTKEDLTQRVLDFTGGLGAALYLEATALPDVIWPQIEACIWDGKYVGATVVIVARADMKTPVNGEVFQVRKARIAGAQGHSGYGTFPRVISLMGAGMDMTPLITKKVSLDEVSENIIRLQSDRNECKITCV